jgi:ketosteroid isomerase-like protein
MTDPFLLVKGADACWQRSTRSFEGVLEHIQHDYEGLDFIPSGDYFVVEGTSQGRMSGKSWAGGKTPGGRFCNVFKFRDGRISSLHVYLDPDYMGEDEACFRWVRIVSGDCSD